MNRCGVSCKQVFLNGCKFIITMDVDQVMAKTIENILNLTCFVENLYFIS